jgi:cobalt-zinc-cadmium efflux system outer membrane protein
LGRPITEIKEPKGELSLRQAFALTLAYNPELAATNYDIRIAEARLLQARLWPNPEVEISGENIAGTDRYSDSDLSENTLLLGQLIELGRKRSARVQEAAAGRTLAEFDYETKKREVFRKTAEQFVELLAAQQRVEVHEGLVRLAYDFEPAVRKRLETGRASDLEKTRIEVVIASARIDLEQARGEVATGRIRLAAQWGSSKPGFGRAVGDLNPIPSVASFDVLAMRLSANPRLARFRTVIAQREGMLAREKAAAVPDLMLRAGPRRIGETNDTTAVVALSVPLPLWNRNQGNIAVAREQVARAGAEQAAISVALMGELAEAYQSLVRSRSTIQILRESVLPGVESALAATNEGYEAGRFSYLEVLDARRATGAARIQHLQALTEYHKAFHAIEALTVDPRSPRGGDRK